MGVDVDGTLEMRPMPIAQAYLGKFWADAPSHSTGPTARLREKYCACPAQVPQIVVLSRLDNFDHRHSPVHHDSVTWPARTS